jgi:hypothetical protein
MLAANTIYRACARGLTVTWFAFTLLWFWSNWGEITGFANTLGALGVVLVWLVIFVATTCILATIEWVRETALRVTWNGTPVVRSRYLRTAWATALSVITAAVVVLLDTPAPDIVYKTF